MFGPPSSPPPTRTDAQHNDLRSVLLPAFGHENSTGDAKETGFLFKPREFVKPKFTVHRDEDTSQEQRDGFLPTPLPTSEAHPQESSPPPSSPQQCSKFSEGDLSHSSKTSDRPALQQMLLVRVPTHGVSVTVGRSSKSSDFAVKPSNRLASRIHARLSVSSEENLLMVECLGWNGLSVSIPKSTDAGVERDEFQVVRGQTLNIECVDGVIMNIHGDKALIEMFDDNHASEVTEDESWSHVKLAEAPSNIEEMKPLTLKRPRLAANENRQTRQSLDDSSIPERENLENEPEQETHIAGYMSQGALATKEKTEENTRDAELSSSVHSDRGESTDESALHTKTAIINEATNQFHGPSKYRELQGDYNFVSVCQTRSRSSSVEPSSENQGRKSRKTSEPIPDQLRSETANVIINHIAFSRQSAVPFGSVRRANQKFQTYSRSQLQEFIRSLDCVGVIEGGVEDTTGRKAEDEYYYIPEKDDNEERSNAVQNSKGHRSLRNCRKTPKQYFYRPLNLS